MLSVRKQAWIMAAGVAGLLGTGAFSSAQAGSAVQCANLMLGFDETAGLDALAIYPA